MDTFQGILLNRTSKEIRPTAISSNLDAPESGFVDNFYVKSLKQQYGDFLFVSPNVQIYSDPGTQTKSYYELFMNKIHIFPNIINLGTVLSSVTRDVIIFNSSTNKDATCSKIESIDGQEVDLIGRTSVPFVIKKYEEEHYQVSVSPVGAPSFETYYTWLFDSEGSPLNTELNGFVGGEASVTLSIFGDRSVFLPWRPEIPISERLQFNTNIISSENGTEQRVSIRNAPRQNFTYNILSFADIDPELDTSIENTLYGWQQRIFALPVWIEQRNYNQDLTIGQIRINIDTTKADIREGSLMTVWKNYDNYEVFEVENVSATGFDVKNGLQNDYTAPVNIIPIRSCNITSSIENKIIGQFKAVRRAFEASAHDNIEIEGYVFDATYEDRAVLLSCQGLSGNTRTDTQDLVSTIIDSDTGDYKLFTSWKYPRKTKAIVFRNTGKDAYWNFRQFLHYLKGSFRSIWIPSFKKDLILSRTYTQGSDTLILKNTGYNRYLKDTNRSNIYIYNNGQHYFRKITSSSVIDDSEEAVSIDIPLDFDMTTKHSISFMSLHRLASDIVNIEHRGINNNICTLEFVEVFQ